MRYLPQIAIKNICFFGNESKEYAKSD